MEINGINLDGLAHEAEKIVLPDPVPGRVVHIDADFLAYQCSAERADGSDQKSIEDMKHNAGLAVNTLKLLAGATDLHLHLTPSASDKGGRNGLAIQKEYQGNRKDKPKPRYLHLMRDWLAASYPSTQHLHCEADDGMSSSQYRALADGAGHLSIIASKDKDLNMVPGLHLGWDTGEILEADTFGDVYLRVRPSGTKVLDGYGQKFFWAQMLAGDTADNIQGLPKLAGYYLNEYSPTVKISAAKLIVDQHGWDHPLSIKASKLLRDRPAGLCGPVLVETILRTVSSHKQAFVLVRDMYKRHGEVFGFKHWETGEPVSWQQVFVSEAKLLWMRRNPHDPNDVLNWLKEINV